MKTLMVDNRDLDLLVELLTAWRGSFDFMVHARERIKCPWPRSPISERVELINSLLARVEEVKEPKDAPLSGRVHRAYGEHRQ